MHSRCTFIKNNRNGPSINDVTNFLRFMTPSSPVSPILLDTLESPFGKSPLPHKWVTLFMDGPEDDNSPILKRI